MITKTSLNGWRENSISPIINYQYEKITEKISRINKLTEKLVKVSGDRMSINPVTIADTACHINFLNIELRTLKNDIFKSFNKDISQLEKCLNNEKFNIKLFIAENIWDRESFLRNNTQPRDEVRNFLYQKGLIKEKELHL